MFEAAELGQRISKAKYESTEPKIRSALLEAQFALSKTNIPVIVIVSGADGAGKGEVVHRLNEWLDPRVLETHAFWQASDEELERPRYWRFWRALPARGRIGILLGSWYSAPIIDRVYGRIKNGRLDSELDRIAAFEKMLAADGALLVKLWFHLGEKEQKRTLKNLEKDPKTHWRVLPVDWKHYKLYDTFTRVSERALRRTDAGHAPWHIIEAADRRHRDLTAGRILLDKLTERLHEAARPRAAAAPPQAGRSEPTKRPAVQTILNHVDLTQKLSPNAYKRQLQAAQAKLTRISWEAFRKKVSTIAVFEGWDAAGKGSAIRRVTMAVDPRLYRIVPIAAPTDEERAHHYFWRFWRHLPRAGRFLIFDRSWYGRVLVERVEGFAQPEEWRRAYLEINEFEEQLAGAKMVLAKFWIHLSKDEQLRRFKERESIPFKRHKITAEDWRNRKRWEHYEEAVNDMVARTSTEFAPWTLVAGDDKRFARVQILNTLCEKLEAAL